MQVKPGFREGKSSAFFSLSSFKGVGEGEVGKGGLGGWREWRGRRGVGGGDGGE